MSRQVKPARRRTSRRASKKTLDESLERLELAQLVRRLSDTELAYMFKHTLTQESVYESMLKTRRADLHRAVAEAMEHVSGDQLEQNAAVLALHYERAGMPEKAFTYAAMAGDTASRAYAHQEAIALYDRALALGQSLGKASLNARLRTVYASRGRVFEVMGLNEAAIENYRGMIAHARSTGDIPMEADGLTHLLTTQGTIAKGNDLDEELNRALDLARRSGEPELVGRALWNIGLSTRFTDPERAAGYFRQTLEYARDARLAELEAFALTDLAIEMQLTGAWRKALAYGEEGLERFRALDDKPMIANALGMVSEARYVRAEREASRVAAQEGVEISRTIENPWGVGYNEWNLLQLKVDAGEFDAVLAGAEPLLKSVHAIGIPLFSSVTEVMLGVTYAELGQFELALSHAEAGLRDVAVIGGSVWTDIGESLRARVLLRLGQVKEARAILDSLRAHLSPESNYYPLCFAGPGVAQLFILDRQFEEGLRFCDRLVRRLETEETWTYAAEMYYWRGLMLEALGEFSRAESDQKQAQMLGERGENRLLLWRVHAALAGLYARRGAEQEAREAQQHAVELIRIIAGNISDPARRRSFLDRTDVHPVLAK